MSNRERWIIYPLLFLAIALATKAQLDQALRLDTDEIFCRQLTVVDEDGQRKLRLLSDQNGGLVALMNGRGEPAVVVSAAADGGGDLHLGGPQRPDAVSLMGTASGGQVRLAGGPDRPVVVLGFAESSTLSGLYALRDNEPVLKETPEATESRWGLVLPLATAHSGSPPSGAESPAAAAGDKPVAEISAQPEAAPAVD